MAFNLPTGGNSYNNYSQPAASPTTSGLYSFPDFNNYLNNYFYFKFIKIVYFLSTHQ